MQIMGKKISDYVGYHEVVITLLVMALTTFTCFIESLIPSYISSITAVCIVAGLLCGPYACLGINIISILFNVLSGVSIDGVVLDAVEITFATLIPYRLWYSLDMNKDDRPPVLDSVGNVVKFVVIVIISSVVFTVISNVSDSVELGTHTVEILDLTTFFNAMSFSMMLGLSGILILRYFGFKFYTPKFGGTPDDFRRKIDWRWYYTCLAIAIAVPITYLTYRPDVDSIATTAVCLYLLLIMFLIVPVEHSTVSEKTKVIWGLRVNTFNGSLIERMIVILLIYGVAVCIATVIATRIGILSPLFDLTEEQATTFYMSVVLMGFFLPSIAFLWYLEKNVTVPIETMSSAARNFIDDEYGDSGMEFRRLCSPLTENDTEIGELARSLTKMTDDIEEYIYDIKSLNSAQEKYKAELDVAQNIQESFIPRNFESLNNSGITVAGSMDAARYVGGDFYDFFTIDTDHIGLVIGDVSGKGVPAALFMAVTKSIIESQSRPGLSPSEIMAKVNINLCRNNDENMFVTSWLGIMELSTGNLRYCSAGHNPPVIIRKGCPAELMECKPSLVLGAREGVQYTTAELDMSVGDCIILYTDGVTEANDGYQGFYGTERLMRLLDENEYKQLDEQIKIIRQDIAEFTNNAEQFDDITMLMFRYDGKPKHPEAEQS